MSYVIACGDEGVQINEGSRLGILGAGFSLPHLEKIIKTLKKLLGSELMVAANEENAWIREKLDLATWEQTNASAQQHLQVLADQHGLKYAGFLPFSDPQELAHGIKGHMVRPPKMHLANKIQFTLAGGEQTFNLGQFVISAEWVSAVDKKVAQEFIDAQVEFYQKLTGAKKLIFVFEEEGKLGKDLAAKNRKVLADLGYQTN